MIVQWFFSPHVRKRACAGALAVLAVMSGARAASSDPQPVEMQRLRHQIELFVSLNPGDSILAIRRVAADTLEVARRTTSTGAVSALRAHVPEGYLDRLAAANPFITAASSRAPDHPPDIPSAAPTRARIREDYMGGQLGVSAYVYGVALPVVFDLNDRAGVLIPAFLMTGSLAAHAIYSLNNPLTQTEVLGMNYVSAGTVLSSYALSYGVMGVGDGAFDVGSVMAFVTYPVSLFPGRALGARYNENPGVLSKRMSSAGIFATTGLVLPWVYFENPAPDVYARLAAWQFLAFGALGHGLGDLYRPGETLTDGVNTGIYTHMGFGALAGTAIAVTLKPDGSRAVTSLVMASTLTGFAEGLWFFHDRYDGAEKANYAGFGTLGGMLLAGSIAWAAETPARGTLWLLTGGALGGYVIVYNGMSDREASAAGAETGRRRAASPSSRGAASGQRFVKDVSVFLAPLAETVRTLPGVPAHRRAGTVTRYRVPGVTVRF